MLRPQSSEGLVTGRLTLVALGVVSLVLLDLVTLSRVLAQVPAGNTSPQAPTGPPGVLGRKSPPQPQQKQALEYFVGTWNMTWSGRESALSPGPGTGTVTYSRLLNSNFLEIRSEGKSDAGAYKQTGTLGWHADQKILALHERLAGGVEVLSIGDWTSPISIRFESAPVRAQGQTLTLRRTYGIVSAQSFTVLEEVSTDGKPFVRLGSGVFGKQPAKQ